MPNRSDIDAYFEEKENNCILYDRACILCGECDRCDLDPNKICDNCEKCINDEKKDKNELLIDRVITEEEYEAEYCETEEHRSQSCEKEGCQAENYQTEEHEAEEYEEEDEKSDLPETGIDPDELEEAWKDFRAKTGWKD